MLSPALRNDKLNPSGRPSFAENSNLDIMQKAAN